MQVTLDLPDDALAKAEAVAKQQSRSLGSVIVDLIRAMKPASATLPPQVVSRQSYQLPVSKGRPFTQEELERALEEDGLP